MNNNRLPEDILIKAETLKKNLQQERDINDLVLEIIKNINDEIHKHHQKGKREVVVELPYTFNIPDMTNADCQRRIWATVIQIMENHGYEVQIEFNNAICHLHVNWLTQKDKANIVMYDTILRKHRLRPDP
jgi:aspartyl/asparaginyl-tRNA synthetase